MTGPIVYFVQRGPGGPIKIGTTTDLTGRLRSLQTASAELLRVLATVPGGESEERRYHRQFSALRLGGEWFTPHTELLAFIQGARAAVGRPTEGVRVSVEKAAPRAPDAVTADGSHGLLGALVSAQDADELPVTRRRGR